MDNTDGLVCSAYLRDQKQSDFSRFTDEDFQVSFKSKLFFKNCSQIVNSYFTKTVKRMGKCLQTMYACIF